MSDKKPTTLYDKIWNDHLVHEADDGTCLLYIDRHLVHEVTSPQAFEGLRMTGRKVHAPEKLPYAINRYSYEAERHYGILDARLGKGRYMLGDTYTIVDMDVWGWSRLAPFVLGDEVSAKMANLKRHLDEINARPAAARAVALKDKHAFKTEMDDEARRHMFPQNVRLAS